MFLTRAGADLPDTLICPNCHEKLWVAQMQVPLLTCPRCLRVIVNPNAATGVDADRAARGRASMEPRQVIPIEEEVNYDLRGTVGGLTILALTLLLGAVVAMVYSHA